MISRLGLFLTVGVLMGSVAQAASVSVGTPQLLDGDTSAWCVVPATFQSGGVSKRVFYLSVSSGIAVKPEGQPSRVLYYRAAIKGGEQKAAGVFLATTYGLMYSPNSSQVQYVSSARFTLVTPYGWVKDGDGLWNVTQDGLFNRSTLPIAPWRNVVGIAPSTNYLYGPNLLWVGAATNFNYYQKGLYQAVVVNGVSYPTLGIPDFQRVSGVCGVTGGYLMVYNGSILLHKDVADPYALLYTDTGVPADNYALQSVRYGPTDVDAVAYVGRTLWYNLAGGTPTSLVMPGTIRYVAIDSGSRQLLVCTSLGTYAVPYSLF